VITLLRQWRYSRAYAKRQAAMEAEVMSNYERFGMHASSNEMLRSIAAQAMRILDASGQSGVMSDHARRWWADYKSREDRMRGMLRMSPEIESGELR
jgi:hypothetical protein